MKKNRSDNSKYKIVFIIDSINDISGTERQLLRTIELIDSRKFKCYLICLKPPIVKTNLENIKANYKELNINSLIGFRFLLACYNLSYYLKHIKVDIVVTYFFDASFLGVIAAKLAGVKKIVSCRRDLGFWHTPAILKILRLLDVFVHRYLANSEAVKMETSRSEKIPLKKISVIYNGIDLETSLCTDTNHSGKNKIIIGTVANFSRKVKRVDLFIKAASIVLNTYQNVEFVIVGGGYLRKDLENLASQLGIQEKIIFKGIVNNIYPLIRNWDIGVITSDSEGFSNSILEYMLCGVPVIATAVGGNIELIEHGKTGILINKGNSDQLANAITLLLSDRNKRCEIGSNGKKIVQQRFGWNHQIKVFEGFLLDLIEKN